MGVGGAVRWEQKWLVNGTFWVICLFFFLKLVKRAVPGVQKTSPCLYSTEEKQGCTFLDYNTLEYIAAFKEITVNAM